MSTTDLWEYEAADPEVGILADAVTHCCPMNLEADEVQDAGPPEVTLTADPDPGWVVETSTYRCPVCDETVSHTARLPAEWFEVTPDHDE